MEFFVLSSTAQGLVNDTHKIIDPLILLVVERHDLLYFASIFEQHTVDYEGSVLDPIVTDYSRSSFCFVSSTRFSSKRYSQKYID